MCGIAGCWEPEPRRDASALAALAQRMGDALRHRGPDDDGVWTDAAAGLALAHRRLAIVDLSPAGHQPMHSADARYVIVYNGEIYNFQHVQRELVELGHAFRGHSDTEVLLAAIVEWGIEGALARCDGMFAFALWDRRERRLWFARDRVGKKPLYYGCARNGLVFGSELKALLCHPDFDPQIDPQAVSQLLRYDYVSAPRSIYLGVRKLEAGHLVCFDAASVRSGSWPTPRAYWDAQARIRAASLQRFDGDESLALDRLDELMRDAVKLRLHADVPVGLFLSGGTDSSLIAALAQQESTRPVQSFTIVFTDRHDVDGVYARAIAARIGTAHTEFHVGGADALAVVPRLAQIYDEPFADVSMIPSVLVAQLARAQVKVALSGDGGDELFFGYLRYVRALRNLRWHSRLPAAPRRMLGRLLTRGDIESARTGGAQTVGMELAAEDIDGIYLNRISRWRAPARVVRDGAEPASAYTSHLLADAALSPAERMMSLDFLAYLPEDILVKLDRSGMSTALEARSPLLDSRVAEFAWALPDALKVRTSEPKHLLKRLLRRYLPDELVDRPKSGFGAPVGAWLSGPLREWAGDLLSEERLRRDNLLDAPGVLRRWNAFAGGERKWHTHLWSIVMLQSWLEWQRDFRNAQARA
jgi:asparagine synthase (glutamine-hydrolysing)